MNRRRPLDLSSTSRSAVVHPVSSESSASLRFGRCGEHSARCEKLVLKTCVCGRSANPALASAVSVNAGAGCKRRVEDGGFDTELGPCDRVVRRFGGVRSEGVSLPEDSSDELLSRVRLRARSPRLVCK